MSTPATRRATAVDTAHAHGLRALLDRLVGVRDCGVVPFVVLPLVGLLLLALILITAGCGPPN